MASFHMVFFILWRYIIIVWPYVCLLTALGLTGVLTRSDPEFRY